MSMFQQPPPAAKLKYDRFNDLYVQALKQKLNHEKVMQLNIDEECTFMPDT